MTALHQESSGCGDFDKEEDLETWDIDSLVAEMGELPTDDDIDTLAEKTGETDLQKLHLAKTVVDNKTDLKKWPYRTPFGGRIDPPPYLRPTVIEAKDIHTDARLSAEMAEQLEKEKARKEAQQPISERRMTPGVMRRLGNSAYTLMVHSGLIAKRPDAPEEGSWPLQTTRNNVEHLAIEYGIDPRVANSIKVTTSEMVTNLRQHALGNEEGVAGRLRVYFCKATGRVVLSVANSTANPTGIKPTKKATGEGGLGLSISSKLHVTEYGIYYTKTDEKGREVVIPEDDRETQKQEGKPTMWVAFEDKNSVSALKRVFARRERRRGENPQSVTRTRLA